MKRFQDIKPPAASAPKRLNRPHPSKPNRWQEAMHLGVLALTVMGVLNLAGTYYEGVRLKKQIVDAAHSSYQAFLEAGFTQETVSATAERFDEIQQQLWFLQDDRAEWLDYPSMTEATGQLLDAGHELTEAGMNFATFIEEAQPLAEQLFSERIDNTMPSLTEPLEELYEDQFKPALEHLRQANDSIQSIDVNALPGDLEESFVKVQNEFGGLYETLEDFDEIVPAMLTFLGNDRPQNVLIVLQNNWELRLGGGFMGSVLLLTLDDGYIDARQDGSGMKFYDIYELAGQFHEVIEPSQEIGELTNRWNIQDANISPDMAISAEHIAWFFEQVGPSVDHVITLDLTVAEALLSELGPFQIDSLPQPLTAENFTPVISYMVEAKLTGQTTPKAILGEFLDTLIEQMRSEKPWREVTEVVLDMTLEKHMSFNSQVEEVQAVFEDLGMTGALPTWREGEDVFGFFHTDIGGNKTNRYATSDVVHETFIHEDGTVENRVTITRKHHWNDDAEKQLRETLEAFGFAEVDDTWIDLLGGGTNVAAIRVYVPEGAALVDRGLSDDSTDSSDADRSFETHSIRPSDTPRSSEAYTPRSSTSPRSSGDDDFMNATTAAITQHHDEELGLDYFYLISTVYPGDEETISFSYTLPFALDFDKKGAGKGFDEYRLNVLAQPGELPGNTIFTKTIQADEDLTHHRSYPEELLDGAHELGLGIYAWTTTLTTDLHLAQLWGG